VTTRPFISRDRTLAALGALALLAAILVPSAAAPASANGCPSASTGGTYGGGDGSEATPFLIASTAHLLELSVASTNLDKHFKQTAPIDLTGCAWTPIDTFTGSYDGGGYTISRLTFDDDGEDEAGMFSEVRGSVTRVVLVGVDVNGDDYVGGLVGYLNGAA
jgi:hypothetical protein